MTIFYEISNNLNMIYFGKKSCKVKNLSEYLFYNIGNELIPKKNIPLYDIVKKDKFGELVVMIITNNINNIYEELKIIINNCIKETKNKDDVTYFLYQCVLMSYWFKLIDKNLYDYIEKYMKLIGLYLDNEDKEYDKIEEKLLILIDNYYNDNYSSKYFLNPSFHKGSDDKYFLSYIEIFINTYFNLSFYDPVKKIFNLDNVENIKPVYGLIEYYKELNKTKDARKLTQMFIDITKNVKGVKYKNDGYNIYNSKENVLKLICYLLGTSGNYVELKNINNLLNNKNEMVFNNIDKDKCNSIIYYLDDKYNCNYKDFVHVDVDDFDTTDIMYFILCRMMFGNIIHEGIINVENTYLLQYVETVDKFKNNILLSIINIGNYENFKFISHVNKNNISDINKTNFLILDELYESEVVYPKIENLYLYYKSDFQYLKNNFPNVKTLYAKNYNDNFSDLKNLNKLILELEDEEKWKFNFSKYLFLRTVKIKKCSVKNLLTGNIEILKLENCNINNINGIKNLLKLKINNCIIESDTLIIERTDKLEKLTLKNLSEDSVLIFSIPKNLKKLKIINCMIQEINFDEDEDEECNLESLIITNNNIQNIIIPNKVKYSDLSFNLLSFVKIGNEVKYLNLSNNKIKEIIINEKSEKINLSNNKLKNIILDNTSVEYLDVSFNELENIKINDKLKILIINNNNLKNIIIDKNNCLEELVINDNPLENIIGVENLKSIKRIILYNTNIKDLYNYENVKYLFIDEFVNYNSEKYLKKDDKFLIVPKHKIQEKKENKILQCEEPQDPNYKLNEDDNIKLTNYPLNILFCTELYYDFDWRRVFNCPQCSYLGEKISSSLIKNAVESIFSLPEQCIVELIVNGLDSYKKTKSVGKFGMGFFSVLYWLYIGNESCLEITTKKQDKEYGIYLKIFYDKNAGFLFDLNLIEKENVGTNIYLKIDSDNYDYFENFEKFIYNLEYYVGGIINYNGERLNDKIEIEDIYKNSIVNVILEYEYILEISIEDFGSGMDLDVIFNNLLIPSSSTKKIKIEKYNNISNSFITKYNKYDLVINVGGVTILNISLDKSDIKEFTFVINLPIETRITVARDDIIYDNFIIDILMNEINNLFELSLEKNYLNSLFSVLKKYEENSVQTAIKGKFTKMFIDKLYDYIDKKIIVPCDPYYYQKIKRYLFKNKIKVNLINIKHDNYDTLRTILLDNSINLDCDMNLIKNIHIFYNNVFDDITDANIIGVLFVNKKYKSDPNILDKIKMSYQKTRLIPEIQEEYKNSLSEKISEIKNYGMYKNYISEIYNSLSIIYKKIVYFTKNTERKIIDNLILLYIFINKCQENNIFGDITEQKILTLLYTIINTIRNIDSKLKFVYGYEEISIMETNELPTNFMEYIENMNNKKVLIYQYTYIMDIINNLTGSKNVFFDMFTVASVIFNINFYREKIINIEKILKTVNKILDKSENLYEYLIIFYVYYFYIPRLTNEKELTEKLKNKFLIKKYIDLLFNHIREKYDYETIKKMGIKIIKKRNIGEIKNLQNKKMFNKLNYAFNEFIGQKFEIFPKQIYEINADYEFKFKLSKMIKCIFEKDYDFSSHEGSIVSLKEIQEDSDLKTLSLQFVEIAINEGSSKQIEESVVTELVQNSIDAYRNTEFENDSFKVIINISIYKIEEDYSLVIEVKDKIGIEFNNLLSLFVPYLSGKVRSENVTGELGNGFFNAYKSSEYVEITSIPPNKEYMIYILDKTIKKEGRVLDLDKEIKIQKLNKESVHNSGTNIKVVFNKKKLKNVKDDYIVLMNYINNIYSIISGLKYNDKTLKIYLNNILLDKTNRKFIINDMDCYLYDKYMPSYILTKGIPYMKIETFLKQNNINKNYINLVKYGFAINITDKYYRPVQSRTKIKTSSELIDKILKICSDIKYLNIIENPQKMFMIENFDSSVTFLEQLYFKIIDYHKDLIDNGNSYNDENMITYYKYENLYAISEIINIFINNKDDMENCYKYFKGNYIYDIVMPYVKRWFSIKQNKNKEDEIDIKTILGVDVGDEGLRYMNVFKTFYESFKECISEIPGSENYEDINIKFIKESFAFAYYGKEKKELVINIDFINPEEFEEFEKILLDKNIQFLDNDFYIKYFGLRFPPSVIIHEFEHIRRENKDGHSLTYDDLLENKSHYTFAEASNAVLRHATKNKLIEKWLSVLSN